jgi:alkanesulfonate monooxygenase SsuD/methylene tetrahydromethanopterin reductase-like flavin-dependent oxidoreductase (luciferase family)
LVSSFGSTFFENLLIAILIAVGGLGATSVGTPEKVADEMERWVNEGDVDGFNIVSSSRSNLLPRIQTTKSSR